MIKDSVCFSNQIIYTTIFNAIIGFLSKGIDVFWLQNYGHEIR